MNILITGGTGFIGSYLVPQLAREGHTITLLTRAGGTSRNRLITNRKWNGKEMPLEVRIAVYDAVINLAGASIGDSKWTDEYKKQIRESRVNATRACVEYINGCTLKPKVFLCGSAVGYYGGDNDNVTDETAASGSDFMADVCKEWEESGKGAQCRTVFMRIGVVLGKDGGALPKLLPLYKWNVGGKLASGKQGFSWIHIQDIVKAIQFLLQNDKIEGPVNLTAPQWVTQGDFSKALDSVLGRKNIFTVPKFMLNLVLGERAIIVWGGQKVPPTQLLTAGFQFDFPEISLALKNLCK